jgi:predicted DNA-binding transcriptional regulator YafY
VLLPRLRELGVAPVVEGPGGVVHLTRKDAHRAATPRTRGAAHLAESAARLAARTSATVTAIRAGDRAASVRPAAAASRPRQSPASALALLREAVDAGGTVWIGYVDSDGSTHERVVDPRRLDGGRLVALDHRSEELRSFAVHRISSVRPL